jgi:hypothetical protein
MADSPWCSKGGTAETDRQLPFDRGREVTVGICPTFPPSRLISFSFQREMQ